MIKVYSEIAVAIDLIIDTYKSYNPIVIQEFLEKDLDIEVTIYQIIDYFEIMKIDIEDYEKYYIKHY